MGNGMSEAIRIRLDQASGISATLPLLNHLFEGPSWGSNRKACWETPMHMALDGGWHSEAINAGESQDSRHGKHTRDNSEVNQFLPPFFLALPLRLLLPLLARPGVLAASSISSCGGTHHDSMVHASIR